MKREIECCVCHKFLGEIRDARIVKGISYLCPKCNKKIKRKEETGETDSVNFLKNMFNM